MCLAKGKGDVAFVKDATVGEMTKNYPANFGNMSDYQYLCPDGTRKGKNYQTSRKYVPDVTSVGRVSRHSYLTSLNSK